MALSGKDTGNFIRTTGFDLLLVVALSAFAWGALLAPGYFLQAHDARHSVFYLLEFDKAFQDGSLYPRWGIDFAIGYGYPLFSYYSPVVYYVAEVFHLLGAGLTDAVKLTYLLATILSGFAMYGFVRRLFGRGAGLLAATIYVYIPYHLLDIYVRGAFAEFAAFVFLPLVFWAFFDLLEKPNLRRIALAALAYAGLIMTHNATFMMVTPVLIAYCLYLLLKKRGTDGVAGAPLFLWGHRLLAGLGAAVLAVALSAVLLFPAMLERGFIAQEQWTQGSFNYLKHFTYPGQLLSPFWGYGYAGEGINDDMSLQLGVVAIALTLLSCAWRPRTRRGQWNFFFITTWGLVLLMLPVSMPIWQAVPVVSLVQFPWRLLILTAFTLAVTSAALVAGLAEDKREETKRWANFDPAVVVMCLLVILASQSYVLPQFSPPDPRSETEKAIIDFETYYPPDRVGMTAWVQEQPHDSPLVQEYLDDEPLTRARLLTGNGEVRTLRSSGSSIEVVVSSATAATLQCYVYYFPAWQALIDGQPVPIRPDGPHALLTLDVPAGEHHVILRYTDTPWGQLGKLVSVVALLCTVGLLVLKRRQT